MLLSAATVLFISACATPQSVPEPVSSLGTVRPREELRRPASSESPALRAELAEARIAMAKKEAELLDLRQQLAELRQVKATQLQTVEAKQAELLTLRSERDQLLRTKQELQVHVAEVPQLRQTATDLQALNTRLQSRLDTLDSTVATIMTELERIKREVQEVKTVTVHPPVEMPQPAIAPAPVSVPPPAPAKPEPDPTPVQPKKVKTPGGP